MYRWVTSELLRQATCQVCNVTSASVGPPRGGTPRLQSGRRSLQLLHHLQTESFNGAQDPGLAGTRTRRRVHRVCDGHRRRFVLVKQRLPPARAGARGQHCAESVGRGHLPHVRQRHGRARRQVRVRVLCRSCEARHAEQEPGGGRAADSVLLSCSRTAVIRLGQQPGPVRGAPVKPRREEEERTARRDDEARDPLRSQNQTPQSRTGSNGGHDAAETRCSNTEHYMFKKVQTELNYVRQLNLRSLKAAATFLWGTQESLIL